VVTLHKVLADFINKVDMTGDLEKDVCSILIENQCNEVEEHTRKVADLAKKLAAKFGLSTEAAYIAGLLHDIGNIVPNTERVHFCDELGIEVIEAEKNNPGLLHSKISRYNAQEVFGIEEDICNAIECHSTLRANAERLDLVLFAADKLSWDSIHNQDFIDEMMKKLEVSLEHAAFVYLNYTCGSKDVVLHPRTIEAYKYFEGICKSS
jgi:predicted HD superfamily hydrolase involved in NAD metabolism